MSRFSVILALYWSKGQTPARIHTPFPLDSSEGWNDFLVREGLLRHNFNGNDTLLLQNYLRGGLLVAGNDRIGDVGVTVNVLDVVYRFQLIK